MEAELQGIEKELLEKRQQIREKAGDTEDLEEKKEKLLREREALETYIREQKSSGRLSRTEKPVSDRNRPQVRR